MCEELFTLCDLQLGAIVADLDRSVETVSSAASRLIQNNGPAGNQAQSQGDAEEQSSELLVELRKIIVGLQFHDELVQRINHIQALLKLMQDQTTLVAKPDFDSAKMLHMVSGIFSSGAEFRQLGKVFPEYNAANDTDMIELF